MSSSAQKATRKASVPNSKTIDSRSTTSHARLLNMTVQLFGAIPEKMASESMPC